MGRLRGFALLAVLLMVGCRSAGNAPAGVDPVLASLVPEDSTMLAGLRMDAIRATPFFKYLTGENMLSALDDFAGSWRGISELLVASNGVDVVAMARGKFDTAKAPPPGMMFLDSTTMVLGMKSKTRTGGIPPALRQKIRSITIPHQLWMVSLGWNRAIDNAIPHSGNMVNLRKIFRTLDSFTLAADVRSGLNLVLAGDCRSEQDAKSLSDAMRGFVSLGRLTTSSNEPDLLKVYDSIQVQQDRRLIRVTAGLPEDLLEKFVKKIGLPSRSFGSTQGSPPPRRP